MNKRRKNILYAIGVFFVVILSFNLHANTTRDIGEEPVLNHKRISNWILFYTNIERIDRGRPPLEYDQNLEKAALWQAKYCSNIGRLSHHSNVTGMYSPKDRIIHFSSKSKIGGENIAVEFRINMSGVKYYIKKDEKGTYLDFGNYTVYWLNDRQLAFAMINGWMKSPGHRANILKRSFRSMGAGVAKGKYSRQKSYFGCQVFTGRQTIDFSGLIIEKDKTTADTYILSYKGMLETKVFTLKNNIISFEHLTKKHKKYIFQKKPSIKGKLYIGIYDKKTDILYPVKRI